MPLSNYEQKSDVEIRKSILIIKGSPKALGALETFLNNRDWVVFSTTDIKDAFSYLVKNKPSFVMVAVDHPNKKVRNLPKLLTQAFPVCVIGYAEASTTQSYGQLMDSGLEYKINPPATGPAVERAVNKFLKNQQNFADATQARAEKFNTQKNLLDSVDNKKSHKPSEMMNFQSPKGLPEYKAGNLISIERKEISPQLNVNADASNTATAEKLASILYKIAESEGDSEDLVAEAIIAVQRDSRTAQQGPAYRPDHSEAKPKESSSSRQGESLLKVSPAPNKQHVLNNPELLNSKTSSNTSSNKGFVPQYHEDDILDESGALKPMDAPVLNFEPKGTKAAIVATGIEEKTANSQTPKKLNEKEDISQSNVLSEAQRNNVAPLLAKNLPLDQTKPESADNNPYNLSLDSKASGRANHSQSVFSRSAEKALAESVNTGDRILINKLEASSNVACIVVESARFSGYLVVAMGKNRKIDQNFILLVKNRMVKFLKEQGEEINEEEGFAIKVREVDFEGWAIEYASFLRKSIHNGDEIAMAFFPFSPVKNELGQSAAAEMGTIKLDDLQGNIQVDFNLYIYLTANNRYVLYTPKGAKLYVQQKDRLSKMGVTHLHIRKSEAQDLSKYRAQNYLNSKILEYQQKNAMRKSS